jgi:hypothetical protein
VIAGTDLDFATPEFQELVRAAFEAKAVPLSLLRQIRDHREFHRSDWPAVVVALSQPAQDYDVYFDFVVGQVEKLKALWQV